MSDPLLVVFKSDNSHITMFPLTYVLKEENEASGRGGVKHYRYINYQFACFIFYNNHKFTTFYILPYG